MKKVFLPVGRYCRLCNFTRNANLTSITGSSLQTAQIEAKYRSAEGGREEIGEGNAALAHQPAGFDEAAEKVVGSIFLIKSTKDLNECSIRQRICLRKIRRIRIFRWSTEPNKNGICCINLQKPEVSFIFFIDAILQLS